MVLFFIAQSAFARDVRDSDLKIFSLTGGEIRTEYVFGSDSSSINESGKEGLYFTSGMMLFLKFNFNPIPQLKGKFQINILGDVPDKKMELFYGQRGETYYALTTSPTNGQYPLTASSFKEVSDNQRVDLYMFDATFDLGSVKFTAFHHVPRFHWGYEGDLFGLLREATDIGGFDIYDAKAPSGLEVAFNKGLLQGLKIVAGPEIYWDANPKVLLKYCRKLGKIDMAFMHSEDIDRRTSTTAREAVPQLSRQTTLAFSTKPAKHVKLDLGFIMASPEKVGENFVYVKKTAAGTGLNGSDYNAYVDHIIFWDTLGMKFKVGVDLTTVTIEGKFEYAGLVADGGMPIRVNGSLMPYSSLGNKVVGEAGVGFHFNSLHFVPRVFFRRNVIEANPEIDGLVVGSTTLTPGVAARNLEDDPFAVNDNRECFSMEMVFTYDPTGGTWFYNWDNRTTEDAPFACNLIFNYTKFTGITDGYVYWNNSTLSTAGFTSGFPSEDVWTVKSRLVFNPSKKLRLIGELEAGHAQGDGFASDDSRPYRAVTYYALICSVLHKRFEVIAGVKKDGWGPYDYYREFNFTYPWQVKLDACVKFDDMFGFANKSRLGIKCLYRTLDEYSLPDEYLDGENTYMFEVSTYYSIAF